MCYNPMFIEAEIHKHIFPQSEVRKVTQFQLSCWSREGLCEDPVLFMEFIEVVGVAQRRSGNQPLVVHGK